MQTPEAIKLFHYAEADRSWQPVSAAVTLQFYDRNQDGTTQAKEWALEAADLDMRVNDDFSSEPSVARVILRDDQNGVWALKFPSQQAMQGFVTEYDGKLFENMFGKESRPENLDKVSCAGAAIFRAALLVLPKSLGCALASAKHLQQLQLLNYLHYGR